MQRFFLFSILVSLFACQEPHVEESAANPVNWEKRRVDLSKADTLVQGKTYLSVYSEIYSSTMHKTYDLTATVSMRNISTKDTLYVLDAQYYDTHGKMIREYFDKAIYIAPMETVEIVIELSDKEGGTGGNFIFDWKIKPDSDEPFFEAVMISIIGSQGLSFITHGKKVKR